MLDCFGFFVRFLIVSNFVSALLTLENPLDVVLRIPLSVLRPAVRGLCFDLAGDNAGLHDGGLAAVGCRTNGHKLQ